MSPWAPSGPGRMIIEQLQRDAPTRCRRMGAKHVNRDTRGNMHTTDRRIITRPPDDYVLLDAADSTQTRSPKLADALRRVACHLGGDRVRREADERDTARLYAAIDAIRTPQGGAPVASGRPAIACCGRRRASRGSRPGHRARRSSPASGDDGDGGDGPPAGGHGTAVAS